MVWSLAFSAVVLHVLLGLLMSWVYFRRYQMVRLPLGVLTLGDVAFMMGGIVLVPYLYLSLPHWLVVGLLLMGAASGIYFTVEPIVRNRWVIWLITFILVMTDLGVAWRYTTQSLWFFPLNNVVQLLVVVGISNLWAQSGMKARDATLLGLALAVYDFIFTTQLSLMSDLFARLATLPFVPLIAWPIVNTGQWIGIGLGDLLLAAVFPLLMRKAFGRTAGLFALLMGFGAIVLLFALSDRVLWWEIFPVMVVLGPLMALQYGYWRRYGRERTTWQYLLMEPLPGRRPTAADLAPVWEPPSQQNTSDGA
jgi:hypothetical protein